MWTDLLKSPFIWLVSFSYMVVFAAKTSACDWGQMYLIEERGKSPLVGSSFTSSVETGGFFGGILAGYLTDWILRRAATKKRKITATARLPVAIVMMATTGLTLHLLVWNVDANTSQLFITTLGFILGCSLYGPIAIFGVMATEAAPGHLSGTSHAIVALAANGKCSPKRCFPLSDHTNCVSFVFCFYQLVPSPRACPLVSLPASTAGRPCSCSWKVSPSSPC